MRSLRDLLCRAAFLSDPARLGTMRHRTADGIGGIVADEQVTVGSPRAKSVVTGKPQFVTGLPPTVLSRHDFGMKTRVQLCLESHTAHGLLQPASFFTLNAQTV